MVDSVSKKYKIKEFHYNSQQKIPTASKLLSIE